MSVYCTACGTKGIEGGKFCHMCGTRLVTPGEIDALNRQPATINSGYYNPFFGGMLIASMFGAHHNQDDAASANGMMAGAFTGDFGSLDGGSFDSGDYSGFDGGNFGGFDSGGFDAGGF